MKKLAFSLMLLCMAYGQAGAQTTLSCDVNGDGVVNTSDITSLVNVILNPPTCVDLGLPGGVLWATCNVGAESPEESGLYFAWGETTGYKATDSHDFSWTTYKWCNGTSSTLTKYITNSTFGMVDNRKVLESSDDVVASIWGGEYRMPTLQECADLINSTYTTSTWTTLNGVYGLKVTSKSNGNSIFLPAAGKFDGTSVTKQGTYGIFWSSEISNNNCYVNELYVSSSNVTVSISQRTIGMSVRPVRATK